MGLIYFIKENARSRPSEMHHEDLTWNTMKTSVHHQSIRISVCIQIHSSDMFLWDVLGSGRFSMVLQTVQSAIIFIFLSCVYFDIYIGYLC